MARDQVAWNRTWHIANLVLAMVAAPFALFRTRCTWLTTCLRALAMSAPDLTGLLTRRTDLVRMARNRATVRASTVGVSTHDRTCGMALSVLGSWLPALGAWFSTGVSALWQQFITGLRTRLFRYFFMALDMYIVATSGEFLYHILFAFYQSEFASVSTFNVHIMPAGKVSIRDFLNAFATLFETFQ